MAARCCAWHTCIRCRQGLLTAPLDKALHAVATASAYKESKMHRDQCGSMISSLICELLYPGCEMPVTQVCMTALADP